MQRGWYDEQAVTERAVRLLSVGRTRRVPVWVGLLVVVLIALALLWVGTLNAGPSGCHSPRGDELVCS